MMLLTDQPLPTPSDATTSNAKSAYLTKTTVEGRNNKDHFWQATCSNEMTDVYPISTFMRHALISGRSTPVEFPGLPTIEYYRYGVDPISGKSSNKLPCPRAQSYVEGTTAGADLPVTFLICCIKKEPYPTRSPERVWWDTLDLRADCMWRQTLIL